MSNATTKRKLIDDKRPSQGDSGQRLDSPESPVLTRPKIRRCYSNKVLQNESVKPIADCYTTRKNKSCDKSGDKDDKSLHSYSTKMIVDQINEVENILADMKQKLEVRYNSKKQNNGNNGDTVETMKIETDELDVPKSEIELKLPEIPISNIQNNNNIKNEILETFEYPDLFVVYSNVEEERIRKNKLNNKNINEMDHGDNNSAISRHIKSNSNDTVSPNKSINFVTQVTKRKSIDDKRPSRGDNGQRLDNPESPVYENYRNEHDSNKRLQQQQKQQPQQPQQPQQQEQQPLPQQQPQQQQQEQQQQEQQPQQSKTRYRTRGKRGGGKSRAAWRRRNRGGGWGGRGGGWGGRCGG